MKKILRALPVTLFFLAAAINSYAESEPNDNPVQANTLSANGSQSGNVSGTDGQDWYKITLSGDGVATFTLSTSNYTLGAYLRIYKSDGTTQITSIYLYDTDNTESTTEQALTAGTYYVKVERYNGSDNYTVSNSYTADANLTESETNDDVASADIISPNASQRGNMGYWTASSYDIADWWKITISQDGVLDFTLASDDKKIGSYLKIFKQDGTTQIAGFFLSNTESSKATGIIPVVAGIYYAKVEYYSSADGYTLSNTFTPDANLTESETNDDAANADNMTLNSSQRGNIGYWTTNNYDASDWWKLQVPKDGILKFTLDNDDNKAGFYLRLYKQDASTQINSTFIYDVENNISTIDLPVFAGVYYVKVEYYNGADGYTVSNTFTASPDPDETEPNDNAATANTMPLESMFDGNMGYYNSVNYDVADWFKMTVTEAGALKMTINSTVGTLNAYVRVYASDASTQLGGLFIYSSETTQSTSPVLVQPGIYYAKVEYYSGYGAYSVYADFMRKPVAKFDIIQNISSFSFVDRSEDAVTYDWDFGDGSKGIGTNPAHAYAKPGTYNVCLMVTGPAGSDTFCAYAVLKGVGSVVADKAGNTGDATIFVYGGGFKNTSTFYFKRTGYSDIKGTTILTAPGVLRTIFDMRGKATGAWDVVVETPGETPITLPGGFTVVQGAAPQPWVDVVGRNQILKGRWQTYTINYGNNGNVDAAGVPLFLAISRHNDLEVEFKDFEVVLPQTAIDSGWSMLADSFALYFDIDSLHGQPFAARLYPFYVPIIPAGQTQSVNIRIKTTNDIRVVAWVTAPLFQSPMSEEAKACIAWAQAQALSKGFVKLAKEFIPGANCINSVATNYVWNPFAYPVPTEAKPKSKWGSMILNLGTTFLSCASDFIPMSKGFKLAVTVTSFIGDVYKNYKKDQECRAYDKISGNDRNIRAVNSFDPNEITGPAGYGTQKYSLKHNEFPYTIFFENKSDANAPAQEVFVTDTLDKNVYDLSTFSFNRLGFGNSFLYPQPGLKEYTGEIDMRPAKDIIVRMNARLDEATGVIHWHFISLDPATMELTEDPQGGFLNPNKVSPEGEGSVAFSVGLKSSLTHNSVVKNHASIVFDLNSPILTNEWKNTLDMIKPASKINTAVTQSGFKIALDWSGTDQGAGINYYHVFISENDSAFRPLYSSITETNAVFQGQNGVKYKFYSVAVDSVGNVEEKTAEDITVTVGIDENTLAKTAFKIVPNPAKDISSVRFALSNGAPVKVLVKDIQGRDVATLTNTYYPAGTHQVEFNTAELESGIYFISLETVQGLFTQKVVITH